MDTYDVAVIGGGAAGLNGALVLARSAAAGAFAAAQINADLVAQDTRSALDAYRKVRLNAAPSHQRSSTSS